MRSLFLSLVYTGGRDDTGTAQQRWSGLVMQATIRYSEDHTQFILAFDNGDEFEPEDVSEEGIVLIIDGDDGAMYECVLENYSGPLETDTVYRLEKLSTQVDVQEPA